jgi:F-type H+-transporting ATPase subunit delta
MSDTANAYAKALYELALEEQKTDVFLQELTALQESFDAEPAFCRLLSSHSLSKEERCRILDDSFRGKTEAYVLNFLKILTEKGLMRLFPECCRAYCARYDADNGILRATAVTALPLTKEQTEKLTKKLEKSTGKTVVLTNRVDPNCLGGVRLIYEGICVDGTVENHLNSLRELLAKTVL